MVLKKNITYQEGQKILQIDAKDFPSLATIEDNPAVFEFVFDNLHQEANITQIVIDQYEQYAYDIRSVRYLYELVNIYKEILPDIAELGEYNWGRFSKEAKISYIELLREYKKDPIGVYVRLKRLYRQLQILYSRDQDQNLFRLLQILHNFLSRFEKTQVYSILKPFLPGHHPGTREIYTRFLVPDIRPSFVYMTLTKKIPKEARVIDTYNIEDSEVIIFQLPNEVYPRYYIFPPEIYLSDEEIRLINVVKQTLAGYTPKKEDYLDPVRFRETFSNLVEDLLIKNAKNFGVSLDEKEMEKLKKIVVRHTIGFGIIEIILQDENIQDVVLNAPVSLSPVFISHALYGHATTNVYLSVREAESWATKLRLISGRPFDEANPVLDTELDLLTFRSRVCATMEPLSPKGLAFAFRRHRSKPWTLPLFINNKMVNSFAAGLLSLLVDAGRTILVAGTRGAGKTSLVSALMLEIPRKTRIITIEDTLELPTSYFRKLGYDILSLKVRSPLSLQSAELSAEDGIRVSLRLGDSALIVGEVRSKEAQVLYEAMRVGALANAVMGTLHAESPYGVFDRVVHDLGVPPTSFKATDIIVIANPIRDPSGMKFFRRVINITEVRKHWSEDPLKEKGFMDLMKYDVDRDMLYPTSELVHGDSEVLKSLASRIKVFAGNWERLWENIELRAESKQILVDYARKLNDYSILEADFTVEANDVLHKLMEKYTEEVGYPDKRYVLEDYKKWLDSKVKKI